MRHVLFCTPPSRNLSDSSCSHPVCREIAPGCRVGRQRVCTPSSCSRANGARLRAGTTTSRISSIKSREIVTVQIQVCKTRNNSSFSSLKLEEKFLKCATATVKGLVCVHISCLESEHPPAASVPCSRDSPSPETHGVSYSGFPPWFSEGVLGVGGQKCTTEILSSLYRLTLHK